MSNSTHSVICNCGCGELVTISLTGGFAGTTCEVSACETRKSQGIVSLVIRRSEGMSYASPSNVVVRHATGLVEF